MAEKFLDNRGLEPPNPMIRTLEALEGMGLAVAPEELLTPAAAVCLRLKERRERAHLLIPPALAEDPGVVPAGRWSVRGQPFSKSEVQTSALQKKQTGRKPGQPRSPEQTRRLWS